MRLGGLLRRLAFGLRMQHVRAVLARRHAKPAFAGSKQVALVSKTQQISQTPSFVAELLAGQLTAGVIQQLLVTHGLGLQVPLQHCQ